MKHNELTHQVIGAAIEVHRELGPGKSEAAYEAALARELTLRGIPHRVQKPVPVVYKGVKLECGFRLDMIIAESLVLEVKAVELVHPVHRAQVLTYLKLGGWKLALLLNFQVALLKDGIERFVLGLEEDGIATVAKGIEAETHFTQDPVLHAVVNSGDAEIERLAREVLAGALEVHRTLGPGLLASAYEACLCHELCLRGVAFERKKRLPLLYKGHLLPETDEVALLVGGKVVVQPRALISIQPVHEAELLSQLRLGSWPVGLLINFNTIQLREGIRRVILSSGERTGK